MPRPPVKRSKEAEYPPAHGTLGKPHEATGIHRISR
jgi:hypothetical protein